MEVEDQSQWKNDRKTEKKKEIWKSKKKGKEEVEGPWQISKNGKGGGQR